MYLPITIFVLKCAVNFIMGLKVCKLLGTRPKKIKITISTLFFLIVLKVENTDGERLFGGEAAIQT